MQIAIGLYPGFTALDVIGPYQVFVNVPGADVVLCAARRGQVIDDQSLLRLDVSHTFHEITSPDVLVVPGGLISRTLAREGDDPVIDWIRAAHPHTTYTTSVCTGSLLLGAAGLLHGCRATTHWTAYDALRDYGADPVEERIVEDGKVFTAAGVSAGIDLALTLVSSLAGPATSQAIQLGLEYDPQPPFDAGSPSKAPADLAELVRSIMHDAEQRLEIGP